MLYGTNIAGSLKQNNNCQKIKYDYFFENSYFVEKPSQNQQFV